MPSSPRTTYIEEKEKEKEKDKDDGGEREGGKKKSTTAKKLARVGSMIKKRRSEVGKKSGTIKERKIESAIAQWAGDMTSPRNKKDGKKHNEVRQSVVKIATPHHAESGRAQAAEPKDYPEEHWSNFETNYWKLYEENRNDPLKSMLRFPPSDIEIQKESRSYVFHESVPTSLKTEGVSMSAFLREALDVYTRDWVSIIRRRRLDKRKSQFIPPTTARAMRRNSIIEPGDNRDLTHKSRVRNLNEAGLPSPKRADPVRKSIKEISFAPLREEEKSLPVKSDSDTNLVPNKRLMLNLPERSSTGDLPGGTQASILGVPHSSSSAAALMQSPERTSSTSLPSAKSSIPFEPTQMDLSLLDEHADFKTYRNLLPGLFSTVTSAPELNPEGPKANSPFPRISATRLILQPEGIQFEDIPEFEPFYCIFALYDISRKVLRNSAERREREREREREGERERERCLRQFLFTYMLCCRLSCLNPSTGSAHLQRCSKRCKHVVEMKAAQMSSFLHPLRY